MSELKSALELALEKTREIKTTQEEREEIKKQEYISQATGLLTRYWSGEDRLEDIEKILSRDELLTREFLSLVWSKPNTISNINDKLLEVINRFQKNGQTVATKIEGLYGEYQRARGEKLKAIEKLIVEELAQRGIRGAAITPNPEGSREGMQLLAALEKEYSSKLQEIITAIENPTSCSNLGNCSIPWGNRRDAEKDLNRTRITEI